MLFASPTAVAVTVCAVFQSVAVKVSDDWASVTAPVSPLATATVTLPVGRADSRTA